MRILSLLLVASQFGAATDLVAQVSSEPPLVTKVISGVDKIRLLPPSPENPRNSEGDFVQLKDGRLLLVYTHFTGGGGDHAKAHLAGRFSSDGGKTWTDRDVVIVPNEGDWNVMSVSLLRLQSGEIALFYLRKNSLADCRPMMRLSRDEAKSWSEPICCITDDVGYYVMNNDRAVQLASGRLVLPFSLHNRPGDEKPDWDGRLLCYLSDDQGKTWRRSRSVLTTTDESGKRLITQEPGVIELRGGRLMMFARSNAGSQLLSYSEDGGETWSEMVTSSIVSPVSPASIQRISKTGDLLLVWNDHERIDPKLRGKRTPLSVGVSSDEGQTWTHVKVLEDDVNGWYCYTAIELVDEHVLLAHCAGDRRTGGLNTTQITRFPLSWLYDQP